MYFHKYLKENNFANANEIVEAYKYLMYAFLRNKEDRDYFCIDELINWLKVNKFNFALDCLQNDNSEFAGYLKSI
jgi:hypothetical protein